jgi:hypothetical protein
VSAPNVVEELALRMEAAAEAGVSSTTGSDRPTQDDEPRPLYAGVVEMPPSFEWRTAVERFRRGEMVDERLAPRAYELTAELTSLEWLLAYRGTLMRRYAPLATMHKHDGKWDETRRAIRGIISKEIRTSPAKFGLTSVPGAEALTDIACADIRYIDALRKARAEDTEYEQLKDELDAIAIRIEARKVANMQAIKEMGLQ